MQRPAGADVALLAPPSASGGPGVHLVAGPEVPASGRALRKSDARHQAFIERIDRKVHKAASKILSAALRAPDLAEIPLAQLEVYSAGGPPPEGWTKRDLKIARDADSPMKAAPAYLGMAQRTVESYKKSQADRPEAPTINAEVVQVHVSVANYPRRRLSED